LDARKVAHADVFAEYLRELRKFALGEKTEHTDRSAIEHLLNLFAGQPSVHDRADGEDR
jgi:hypothetical protein